jgi:CO/xanthine dehydrogenase Mo-binding subunit
MMDQASISVIGKRIGRIDGSEKVSGTAKYAGDYTLPNTLHLAIVRSTEPHAFITGLDFSELPSDILYFTAKDLEENIIEDAIEDQPVLAYDKVRFYGEPVAIVAADSHQKAVSFSQKVKVKYQKLPIVETPKQALEPDAPLLFEKGNLLSEFHHEKGNVTESFEDCDLILEEDFHLPIQDHAYMEPDAAFAWMEGDVLSIYTSTQNVFHDQRMIARALGIPLHNVHVMAATVGGGFGGKDGHTVQIFAALVAYRTGRPAKIVISRREVFIGTYKRHAVDLHLKMGFQKDGTFRALSSTAYLDTGAYAGLGPAVMGLFSEHLGGPYVISNVKIDSYLVYTDKAPAHAMRGFGAPQGAFATESLINRAANILQIDPIEIRMKNALTQGALGILGQKMEHVVGLREALEAVRDSDLWKEKNTNQDPSIGFGIAAGYLSCGLGKGVPDSAKVEIDREPNGDFTVRVGLVDIGQGNATALAAIAGEALKVPLEKILLIMADTAQTFDCGSTAGSRSVFIAGNAILAAVQDYFSHPETGRGLGEAEFPQSKTDLNVIGFPHAMYTFVAQAVKLKLDPISGQPQLAGIFAATEAGKVINRLSMDGQIQGGIAMSIGYTLGENMNYRNGIPDNQRFTVYILPTAEDIPPIQNVSVELYEATGPYGAKGAAEVATVVIAPAITSAIESIRDLKINRLPLDFEQILDAKEKGSVC